LPDDKPSGRPTRAQIAEEDVAILLDLPTFRRFLSTVRQTAGIETVAYGPDERHLHFMEGRRSLWCDILRTVEKTSPDALLRILAEEMSTLKGTSNGRRKYNRLDTDDDPGGRTRDPGSGLVTFLDYGDSPASTG